MEGKEEKGGFSMVNHPPGEFYKNIAHKYHWLLSSWEKVMERQMEELVPLVKEA